VEEAKKQGVALLVLGQKKRSTTWRLLMMWAGNRVTGGVVEYCIQNAHCMAIAVRRKSNKTGGYMITTKRHKDFWLLA
jgi:nucleotide-binding universal stress UspA family protein